MNRFYFAGSDSSDSGDDNLPYPKPLTRAAFLTPGFDATTFLSSLRNRHQTLEDLRAELRSRSQEVNKELLDLVNNNYQDFLSLGGSLTGGDEKIEEVRLGLLGFKRDVEGLRSNVEERKTEVEQLVVERKVIRKEIQVGRTLLEIDQMLSELEERLMLVSAGFTGKERDDDAVGSSDSGEESDEEQGISLSRLQKHAQQYLYVTRLVDRIGIHHPFVSKQLDRIVRVKDTVLLDLSTALKQTSKAASADHLRVLKILAIYKKIGEISEATRLLKENK